MQVIVTTEYTFAMTPDGAVWSQMMFARDFWQRYLTVFDHVRVVARVRRIETANDDLKQASGEGISFWPLPYFQGPGQYLKNIKHIRRAIREGYVPNAAAILRVPSTIGNQLCRMLHRRKHPFAVEVVGDPWDAFSPGVIHHPLRPLFRRWFTRELRLSCRWASAALYVTNAALQRRYPPGEQTHSVGCSDVELPAQAFVDRPRTMLESGRRHRLITVGSLNQLYKAPDVLIDAVGKCVAEGMDLELVLVGDGIYRSALQDRAKSRGIEDRIFFRGTLTAGDAVRRELDSADLFILPSRQEGLPRALVEAMARALPCIGSDVGGIPELLPIEDLVPANEVSALATKIKQILTDPKRFAEMSRRNLQKAHEYADDVLNTRRTAFYQRVSELARCH